MGNQQYKICPLQPVDMHESTSELILTHKSMVSSVQLKSNKQFKHSIEIQGPSQVYKKSLRKDLNTVQLADEILMSFDMDKCFINQDCDSMVLTKATDDSLQKREVPPHPKKGILRKKTRMMDLAG